MPRQLIDLTGRQFGCLTAVRHIPVPEAIERGLAPSAGAHWECRCCCGGTVIARSHNLRARYGRKHCPACKPVKPAPKRPAGPMDVTGERYGMLIAKSLVRTTVQGAVWLFDCDCGGSAEKRLKDVRYGNTLSCGCAKTIPRGGNRRLPRVDAPRPWRAE